MTVDKMYDEILKHCRGKSCGNDCLLREVCYPIMGRFKDNPKSLEEAYRILKPNDNVTHPSHYTQGNIECIDAMASAFGKEAVKHFCICNAFKYVWRSEHKNGVEDLDKAIWYIDKYKELSADGTTN